METLTPKKSWLARNWIWLIPVGLLAVALSCAGCVVAGAVGFFNIMKSNAAFQDSLAMVQADSRAQQLLGAPIAAGFFVSGEISETPASGTAELSYSVSGPKGSGTVYVSAKKTEGEWVITRLVLVMDKTKNRLIIVGAD